MNLSSFTIKKLVLLNTLNEISKVLGSASKWKKSVVLELTVTDNKLTLVVPGAKYVLDCETKSTAKATIGLIYYLDIIKSQKGTLIECIITDGTIEINKLFINVQTTFFETDSILRSIKMPINYSDLHLLKLEKDGFTEEEIRFNELSSEVYYAKKALTSNIRNTINLLNIYGVNKKDIEEMINKKMGL